MNGTFSDACGVVVATLLGIPLVLLPGYALGGLTGILGFRTLAPGDRLLCGALLGIGLLPALDSLLIQAAGVPVAALATGAAGLVALRPALRDLRDSRDRAARALALFWLGVVAYALIDVDTGTALYRPATIIDLVKHAALTRAIVEHGLPPVDPFFARPERAGYYYGFYTLTALVDSAGGRLVDGRTAFAGLAFWTGLALLGLIDRLLAATGLVADAAPRLVRRAVLLLLPAGSLDILLVLADRATSGTWLPIPEWLNEQVLNWPASLVWVPHHVAGALAGWLGLLALAEVADRTRPDRRSEAAAIGVAGPAFAACAGLSVWVCLGTGLERRWRAAGRLAVAGLLSAALAAPYLMSILANRTDDGAPIRFSIRRFGPLDGLVDEPALSALRLILLPLNYYAALGVCAAGALLFWRVVPRREAHGREAGRLLTLCAAASLLLGGFLRSAILNNDLGARVVLLAQVATLVWTVVALARLSEARRLRFPGLLGPLLALGYATTLYGFVGMRAYPASDRPAFARLAGHPDIDRSLRAAYTWAGTHLPRDLVMQQSPVPRRVFDFGLYGLQPTGVADAEARLFGAPPEAVAARLADVAPIFRDILDGAAVRRRAAAAGIGALVITAQDAPWSSPDSWVWRSPAVYADPRVRILRVEDLHD
ncbi:hypothetical protein [Methylobacterium mesophilicum]|uniref:hypothetical protein n=1 Tax=Methylobacterium mesophilicum TaxID=39956 RepID=UPI002F2F5625